MAKLLEGDKDQKATQSASKPDIRDTSPTPVAEPPSSDAYMRRAEQGWLQSLLGKKKTLPKRVTWGDAASILEKAMSSDKGITGN
eukprot:3865750-Pyramimonas_sp.AAC.1